MTIRAAAALSLLAALLLAPATPAVAQSRAAAPSLRVEDLDAVVRPGGSLAVRGRVENPGPDAREDLRVLVTLQRATSTRLEFQGAVDGTAERRAAVTTFTVPVAPVPPGGRAPLEILRSAEELGLGGVGDEVAGVYPLRLTLAGGDGPLDEVRTGVVVLPELLGEPIRTALLVALDAPLGYTPSDTVDIDPLAGELSEDRGLPALAAALADGPDIPFTVATSGAVLAAAEDAADGYRSLDAAGAVIVDSQAPEARRAAGLLDDIRTLLTSKPAEHIALPYASADLVALVRAGQEEAARQAVGDGVLSAARLTDTRPAPGVLWPPAGLDDATLDALAAGLDLVVVEPANLDTPASPPMLTPVPVRRLQTASGRNISALVADPWLSPLLDGAASLTSGAPAAEWPGDDGPAVAAQRVLAETAAVYFEAPFAPGPRGLLLAPSQDWNPPPEAVKALLDSLVDAPWLRPVTLPQLAAEVPATAAASLWYPETARDRELDPAYVDRVGEARAEVASLTSVLPGDAEPIEAERLVRLAASVQYRGERREEGLTLVDAVEEAAERVFDGVEVIQGPQFSLTGSAGTQIPIEVRNDGPLPVEVLVQLSSPRFAFDPEAIEAIIPARDAQIVRFEVRALTPGATQPILVTVTDVAGERELARGQVVVASRTSSVAAVVLTVGAGLFLGIWWLRDARRRRGGRAAAARPAEDPVNA